MSAPEVEAVLRRLPTLALYDANVFRVTGVPTAAGDGQVRRLREEAELMARLAGETPEEAQRRKDAYEALRNPVVRLVHELFWTWDDREGAGAAGDVSDIRAAHDTAVREHDRALATRRPAGPWREALAAWAVTLAAEETWERMARRARELDDPRVTAGTVARLRELAPQRVLAPSALLAVEAAGEGDPAAAAHLEALAASPFDPELVADALREAARPVLARLRADVEAAGQAPDPTAAAAGRRLLERARPALRVFAELLPDDRATAALHDEVAHAVAAAAIAYVNATGDAGPALDLLDAAAGLALEPATVRYVAANRQAVADAEVLAVVAPLREAGNVDGAAAVLRQWRRQATDPGLRARLDRLVADPRSVRAEVGDEPARSGHLGCGVRPVGRRHVADDDTWVETRCVTVFGVPVFPLGAYLSDERYVYARVPMSPAGRWVQLGVLCVLGILAGTLVFGALGAAVAATALPAAVAADTLYHRHKTRGWLAERLPGPAREATP